MKTLAVIPARGGSKGVLRKNIKLLNGIPLIHYTINAIREILPDNLILVSTEDEEIRSVAMLTGLPVNFSRPVSLAADDSASRDVLLHAIDFAEQSGYYPDTVILLQPTSPFRRTVHIQEAIALYNDDLDMVVSVMETKSNPYYVLFEENADGYLSKSKDASFTRRQDCPRVWEYNGAVYVINVNSLKNNEIVKFKKILKYEMSEQDSVDIDTPLDWAFADFLMKKNNVKN